MTIALPAEASSTSNSLIAPTPEWMMRILTRSSLSFCSESASTSTEPCTSALTMSGSSLTPPSAICFLQGLERQSAALGTERLDLCLLLTEVRDLPRLDGIGHRLECVARLRQSREAEDFDRSRRPRLLGRAAAIVDQRAYLADHRSGDEVVADSERAVLHQDRGDRTAPAIELGLENRAHRAFLRVCLELENVRREQDHLEQQIQVLPLLGRHVHGDGGAAPGFGDEAELGELPLDVVGIRVRSCRSC